MERKLFIFEKNKVPKVEILEDEHMEKLNFLELAIFSDELYIKRDYYYNCLFILSKDNQECLEKKEIIKSVIECIKMLVESRKKNEPIELKYSIANNTYCKAEISANLNSVKINIGANVLLEFTFEEALKYLNDKLIITEKQLEEFENITDYIIEQKTITEVNISRVYNWKVKQVKSDLNKIKK